MGRETSLTSSKRVSMLTEGALANLTLYCQHIANYLSHHHGFIDTSLKESVNEWKVLNVGGV